MGGYRWRGDDGEERAEEAERELAAIREEAAKRTGWVPEMTEMVGWGALDPDYVRLAERRDSGR